ncbi:MAG TPA: SRPBCC family protein, partial [Tepidisphaeraceae bacterium]|nr:SRPBCC family protein [Tepidisphaeraceae bacterium]
MTMTTTSLPQYQEIPQRLTDPAAPFVNVGKTERQVSAIGGAALALFGLTRGSIPGLLLAGLGGALVYRGVSGHCPAYSQLGMTTNHDEAPPPEAYFNRGIHVVQAFTVNKPAEELFRFWRNFENLPQFMSHLESVEKLGENRSRWTATGPAGSQVSWEAEIINEEPNRVIAWRSLSGSDVDNSGSVRFVDAPGDRGTEVRVVLDYIPPAGRLGKLVAMLFGEAPEQTIKEDLRNFKRIMETGLIP